MLHSLAKAFTYENFCMYKSNRNYQSSSTNFYVVVQWLSGRVLDSRPRGCGFKPHQRHCVVSLSKNINPSLVLVQPRKTCPFITERLLMEHKNQIKQKKQTLYAGWLWLIRCLTAQYNFDICFYSSFSLF